MDEWLKERMEGLGQILAGSALFSLPVWARVLDQVVVGAHAITAIGGAILAIVGVIRVFRKPRRARRQNLGAGDAYGN